MYVLFAGCFGINGKINAHTWNIFMCAYNQTVTRNTNQQYEIEKYHILSDIDVTLLINHPEIPPVLSVFQTMKQPPPPTRLNEIAARRNV